MEPRRRRVKRRQHEIFYGRWVLRNLFLEGGIWYARVRDIATGKILRRSTGKRKHREARQEIIEWITKLRDQQEQKERRSSPEFGTAYDRWIALKTVRPSTLRDLELAGRVFKDAFKGSSVESILPLAIEQFLKDLLTAPREGSGRTKGRSPRTRNKHLGTLRGFFRWAKRQGYCESDPTDGLRMLRAPKTHGVVLSPEQARGLIAAARRAWSYAVKESNRSREHEREQNHPQHLWLAILIALQTGLRRANVLGLRWEQVDLEAGRIDIVGAEMKGHRDHSVPIHPELAAELATLAEQSPRPGATDRVLGIEVKSLRRSFLSALRLANKDKEEKDKITMRWHDLRHTFNTWLAAVEPWAVVQRLMAHEPQEVTWDYVSLQWPTLRAAIDRLPRLLGG